MKTELYDVFQRGGITEYKVHEHKAIFSTKEAEEAGLVMAGLNLKNLLIKDKKQNIFHDYTGGSPSDGCETFQIFDGMGQNTICKGRRDMGFAEIDAWFGLLWPSQR